MVDPEMRAKVIEGWNQKAKEVSDRKNVVTGILFEQLQLLKEKSVKCNVDDLCDVSIAMAAIADILLN